MQGKCIIFSAPSGSGKTTILQQLLQDPALKLEFSISATTRKPRGQEKNGKDYYFLETDFFKKKVEENSFVEWEEVYENTYYGTLKSELQRIWKKGCVVAFDVDVKGGMNLKKLFGKHAMSMFIMPPSIEVLEQRLRSRGTETEEVILKRLSRSEYEFSLAPQFDKTIVNDVLEQSVAEAKKSILEFLNA